MCRLDTACRFFENKNKCYWITLFRNDENDTNNDGFPAARNGAAI